MATDPKAVAGAIVNMLKVPEPTAQINETDDKYVGSSDFNKAASWLAAEITKSKKGVTMQVVDLTPALAEVLLEHNDKNRRISDTIVESYARDMENGKWLFNGEPLIVSKDGLLNDGQHRCKAVLEAATTIPAVLVIGVDRASRTTLDQGRTRTVGDYLAMDGHINTNQLGVAASLIWQHRARGMLATSSSQRPTKSEVLAMIDEFPSILESVQTVQRKGADAYGGRSMLAFCHWTFWHASSREVADEFIDRLIAGAGLLARDPILYSRNRIVAERGRLRTGDKAELLFRTWNAWRRRETPRVLPVLGGVLPVVEA